MGLILLIYLIIKISKLDKSQKISIIFSLILTIIFSIDNIGIYKIFLYYFIIQNISLIIIDIYYTCTTDNKKLIPLIKIYLKYLILYIFIFIIMAFILTLISS